MPSRDDLRRKVVDAFAAADAEAPDGADALFDEKARSGQLRRLPLDAISPRSDQPRQTMDPEGLEELTQSIREQGVLQPIRVRAKREGGYEIIAGERRWTAAGRAGLHDIPAVIAQVDDDQAYVEALIENIQREDLNAVDRAKALVRLRVALGRQSWEEVGKVLGIGRQHVHRLLNVTKLPEPIQEDIRVGDLTEKHGRALLTLRGYPNLQAVLWERIHQDRLSGDSAVAAARQLRPTAAVPPPVRSESDPTNVEALPPFLAVAVSDLLEALKAASAAELVALRGRLEHAQRCLTEALAATDSDSESQP